jgi:hypothetical protein
VTLKVGWQHCVRDRPRNVLEPQGPSAGDSSTGVRVRELLKPVPDEAAGVVDAVRRPPRRGLFEDGPELVPAVAVADFGCVDDEGKADGLWKARTFYRSPDGELKLRQFVVEGETVLKREEWAARPYSISLGPKVCEVASEAFLPGGQRRCRHALDDLTFGSGLSRRAPRASFCTRGATAVSGDSELAHAVSFWIEHTYNRRRRQHALGKLTPVEFELAFTPAEAHAAA